MASHGTVGATQPLGSVVNKDRAGQRLQREIFHESSGKTVEALSSEGVPMVTHARMLGGIRTWEDGYHAASTRVVATNSGRRTLRWIGVHGAGYCANA